MTNKNFYLQFQKYNRNDVVILNCRFLQNSNLNEKSLL